MVLCTLISVSTLGGIIVNADTYDEFRSLEGKYEFIATIKTKNGNKNLVFSDEKFAEQKSSTDNSGDHIKGEDLTITPKYKSSFDINGVTGDIMYFDTGYKYNGQGANIYYYTVLCYNTGEPIYLDSRDHNKTISGKNLSGVDIYLYTFSNNEEIMSATNFTVGTYETAKHTIVYDITNTAYISETENLTKWNRESLERLVPDVQGTTYNVIGAVEEKYSAFKWSDFTDNKCKIAYYSCVGNQGGVFLYAGDSKNNKIYLYDKDKNSNLKSTPTYKQKLTLTSSNDMPLSSLIVAGAYAGFDDKSGVATKLGSAWDFDEDLYGSDYFYSYKDLNNKSAVNDMRGSDESVSDYLKRLFTVVVPGKKLKSVGYWYIMLDYTFGETKDNGTYRYASWKMGGTKRLIITVNDIGAVTIVAQFTNRSSVGPSLYAIDADRINVNLSFTGTDKEYECKIQVFDIKDINVNKLSPDGAGTEASVLKDNSKALFSAHSDKLKRNSNDRITCDDKDFKVNNYGTFFITQNDGTNTLLEEGKYYVEIAARVKGSSTYEIKWSVLTIGKKDEKTGLAVDPDRDSDSETSGTTSTIEKIEANRELTFAEERKIDNLNKEIDNKLEMERWAWVYIIMAVCGIVILVYSLLLIVVYYFDLFNSLTEVSFYHKLTFGHMYPVGSAANIEHLKLDEESKVIYATHKTAWISFAIGVIASSILLNGRAVVVAFISLVNWFSNLISNIGG